MGCLAYVIVRLPVKASQVDRVGCSGPFNELAQYFNLKLKETVAQLRKELHHAVITYVDVYSVKYDLIANATKYGKYLQNSLKVLFIFLVNIRAEVV